MAYITIIRKPDKDHTNCANFRPIYFLNVDLKILAKILANMMKPLLSKIIGPEQVGFIPGREASENITKTFNLIHHTINAKIKGLLLSRHAEKGL